jgi:hypothetical protein
MLLMHEIDWLVVLLGVLIVGLPASSQGVELARTPYSPLPV